MRIDIIFACDDPETSRDMAMAMVMPLAPTLLAALTPREHDVTLTDGLFFHPVRHASKYPDVLRAGALAP